MKKNKLSYILFVAFVVFSCDQQETTNYQSEPEKNEPDQEMWDFSVKATKNGRMDALIHAGHMARYSDKSLAVFDQGVDIDFFNKDGEKVSELTADAGELDENTTNVTALGNVVVESDTGITLYTEELFYRHNSNRIYSNVQVMVTTEEGDTLSGVGFESDTELDSWEIKNPHDGVYHKGVDLSTDRWEERDESDSAAATDTTTVPVTKDST